MSTVEDHSHVVDPVNFLSSVLREVDRRLCSPSFADNVGRMLKMYGDCPDNHPHTVSERGARSALAATCLQTGYDPAAIAALPVFASLEAVSPAAAFQTIVTAAARHTCAEPIVTEDWERNTALRQMAQDAYLDFFAALLGVAETERWNAKVSQPGEGGRPISPALINLTWISRSAIAADFADVAFAGPDHLTAYSDAASKIPPERRLAMTVELQRCALVYVRSAAVHGGFNPEYFGHLLGIIVSIYK